MKKVVVVGAGISGLAAAVYLQRSGFDVTVCEQNDVAGGVCVAWKRKGYLFEGAVHWLTGSSPKAPINRIWKEVGALNDNVKIYQNEPFKSVEWEGKIINIYRDIDKTAEHWISVSPEDKKLIKKYVKQVKTLSVVVKPTFNIRGVKAQTRKSGLKLTPKLLPAGLIALKLFNTKWSTYVERFKHPGIKHLFYTIPGDYSAINFIYSMATLSLGDGGFPEGGSLGIIGRMTDTFTSMGGKLLLKTKVKKVNIKDAATRRGIVTGVTLENGVLEADAVIVTQEAMAAQMQLFDPPLKDAWIQRLCKDTKPAVSIFVGVGIRGEFPQAMVPLWQLDEPLNYGGITEKSMDFYCYSKYEGYAPEGCSTITTILKGDTYDFWKKAKDEGRYEEEKRALAGQISRVICKKYPQFEGKIDVIDIATPLTYERYTSAFHGSWMTVLYKGDVTKTYPAYSKYAKGLYFAGHRIYPPGGLPLTVDTGRRAAQMVCRQFGVLFR